MLYPTRPTSSTSAPSLYELPNCSTIFSVVPNIFSYSFSQLRRYNSEYEYLSLLIVTLDASSCDFALVILPTGYIVPVPGFPAAIAGTTAITVSTAAVITVVIFFAKPFLNMFFPPVFYPTLENIILYIVYFTPPPVFFCQ